MEETVVKEEEVEGVELDDIDQVGIHQIGSNLLEKYPPEEWAYIGVGSSPLPFLKYMRMRNSAVVFKEIPVSSVKEYFWGPRAEPPDLEKTGKDWFNLVWRHKRYGTPPWSEKVRVGHYLDHYAAKSSLSGRKKVLVLDAADTGLSVLLFADWLRGHYGPDYRVVPLALSGELPKPDGTSNLRRLYRFDELQLVEGLQDSGAAKAVLTRLQNLQKYKEDLGYRSFKKLNLQDILARPGVTAREHKKGRRRLKYDFSCFKKRDEEGGDLKKRRH